MSLNVFPFRFPQLIELGAASQGDTYDSDVDSEQQSNANAVGFKFGKQQQSAKAIF